MRRVDDGGRGGVSRFPIESHPILMNELNCPAIGIGGVGLTFLGQSSRRLGSGSGSSATAFSRPALFPQLQTDELDSNRPLSNKNLVGDAQSYILMRSRS